MMVEGRLRAEQCHNLLGGFGRLALQRRAFPQVPAGNQQNTLTHDAQQTLHTSVHTRVQQQASSSMVRHVLLVSSLQWYYVKQCVGSLHRFGWAGDPSSSAQDQICTSQLPSRDAPTRSAALTLQDSTPVNYCVVLGC